ncbi:MAG: SagB/ThcOx family dehydrogenase [Candidatus Omnitrophica bacterium]|nr:SagB/ThcOx family dehydrogenase [Candidatus Omnitrophota bacterium]MBU4590101.1 SagB/ThcOx family dehydrogenase [Candidatus Omnitrophota bacterium]
MIAHKNKILACITISAVFLISACALAEELKPIELSKPDLERGRSLMQALKERKSNREFSEKEIPLDIISNLLWAASGVNRPDSGNITVPSAHNWQEIDIYVAMQKGLYLYNTKKHILEPVMVKDIREFTGIQSFTQAAPVSLIYVADFSRMGGYTEEGDFYSATDTGFISQNVYLFCASEGLSTVVLGWVDRPALSKAMSLRDDQKIILTQPVGYPKE